MAIAETVARYLAEHGGAYTQVEHPRTASSTETAETAHVPGAQLGKAVIVEDDGDYLMLVVPATHHVELNHLRKRLGRDIGLATEGELERLFPDCARGAVPPVGPAYGLETYVDEALADQPGIYFEAGDHQHLLHMDTAPFLRLLGDPPRAHLSHRMDPTVHHVPASSGPR